MKKENILRTPWFKIVLGILVFGTCLLLNISCLAWVFAPVELTVEEPHSDQVLTVGSITYISFTTRYIHSMDILLSRDGNWTNFDSSPVETIVTGFADFHDDVRQQRLYQVSENHILYPWVVVGPATGTAYLMFIGTDASRSWPQTITRYSERFVIGDTP